eukprot:IDg22683t1
MRPRRALCSHKDSFGARFFRFPLSPRSIPRPVLTCPFAAYSLLCCIWGSGIELFNLRIRARCPTVLNSPAGLALHDSTVAKYHTRTQYPV